MNKEELQESRLEKRENNLLLDLDSEEVLVTVFTNGRAVIYDPSKEIYGIASPNTGVLQLSPDAAMIEESLPYFNEAEIGQVLRFIEGG